MDCLPRLRLPKSIHQFQSICLIIAAFVLISCAQSQVSPTRDTALPSFSDWRVAYVSQDSHLHVVTPVGKTDIEGPVLPDLPQQQIGMSFETSGFSPNGHLLSYALPELRVLDLSAQPMGNWTQKVLAELNFYWSPDGKQLAFRGGDDIAVNLVKMPDGSARTLAGTAVDGANPISHLCGWTDSTHLAVMINKDATYYTLPNGDHVLTSIKIASLDISTGYSRVLTTITSQGLSSPFLTLSPDGKKALFFNRRSRDYTYTPIADEIDMQTGTITSLPHIAQAMKAGFTSLAWKPGTQIVAVSTGWGVNGDLTVSLLDLSYDSATHLMDNVYPKGWVPNGGPLIVTTGQQIGTKTGPYTISAVAIPASGQPTVVNLTTQAYTFPYLGLVRTA